MTLPPPKHAGPRLAAGFLLVPSAVAMLFWNEEHERAVATALAEGGGAVISASATAADPRNEGGLAGGTARARGRRAGLRDGGRRPYRAVVQTGAVRTERAVGRMKRGSPGIATKAGPALA